MKNKGVMISLAAILVIGILITKGTYGFIEKNSNTSDMVASQIAESEATGALTDERVQEQSPNLAAATVQETDIGFEMGLSMDGIDGEKAYSRLADNSSLEDSDYSDAKKQEKLLSDSLSMDKGVKEDVEEAVVEEGKFAQKSISPLDTVPAEKNKSINLEEKSEEDVFVLESQSYYKKRLQDLDNQIQKNRESQSEPNINSSARSVASNELKLWDSEMNTIYSTILERLNKKDSEVLVAEQRAWMKERDSLAMEAAKNSANGSSESIEYTISLIDSTRLRAYKLVEEYEEELKE